MRYLYLIFVMKVQVDEPSNLYFAAALELLLEAFLLNTIFTLVSACV